MEHASGYAPARRTIGAVLIGTLTLFWSAGSWAADDPDKTKDYVACMDKAGGVTSEMLNCISDEMNRQDARLNENYKGLLSKLAKKRMGELQEAQRAWIKFRQLNCNLYGSAYEGGSLAQVAVNDCVLEATTDRASELKRLLPEN